MSREALIAAFLGTPWLRRRARTEPLAQDASFRRYLRLTGGPRPAVLMDAPPPEDVRPFVRIARHLAGIGVSVPEIFAADEAAGLLLEEDLGDDLLRRIDRSPRHDPDCAVRRRRRRAGRDAARRATAGPAGMGRRDHGRHRAGDAVRLVVARHVRRGRTGRRAPGLRRRARDHAGAGRRRARLLRPSRLLRRQPDLAAAARAASAASACSTSRAPRSAIPPTTSPRCCRTPAATSRRRSPSAPSPATWPRARNWIPRRSAPPTPPAPRSGTCGWPANGCGSPAATAGPDYLAHGPRTWRLLERPLREPAAAPLAAALDRWIPPDRRGNPPDLAA